MSPLSIGRDLFRHYQVEADPQEFDSRGITKDYALYRKVRSRKCFVLEGSSLERRVDGEVGDKALSITDGWGCDLWRLSNCTTGRTTFEPQVLPIQVGLDCMMGLHHALSSIRPESGHISNVVQAASFWLWIIDVSGEVTYAFGLSFSFTGHSNRLKGMVLTIKAVSMGQSYCPTELFGASGKATDLPH